MRKKGEGRQTKKEEGEEGGRVPEAFYKLVYMFEILFTSLWVFSGPVAAVRSGS